MHLDWTFNPAPGCFATVSDFPSSAEVNAAEDNHKCDPRLLETVQKYRKLSYLVSAAEASSFPS
jgi:hypothetical protein